MNAALPQEATQAYEALRRAVLAPEQHTAQTDGWVMLVRRGLAAWSLLWRSAASTPCGTLGSPSLCCGSPLLSESRSELVKLVASLILTPVKENRYA